MFKFRLTSVLRLREHKEKECKDHMAFCIKELRLAEFRRNEIIKSIRQKENELQGMQLGKINLPDLLRYKEYLVYQRKQLLVQTAAVEEKKKALHTARIELVQAMKDKKILNKLEDKQYNNYLYQENKKEQAVLDDLAGRR